MVPNGRVNNPAGQQEISEINPMKNIRSHDGKVRLSEVLEDRARLPRRRPAVGLVPLFQDSDVDKPVHELVIELDRNAKAASLAPLAQTTLPIGGADHWNGRLDFWCSPAAPLEHGTVRRGAKTCAKTCAKPKPCGQRRFPIVRRVRRPFRGLALARFRACASPA